MINEFIFIIHVFLVSIATIVFARIGKEALVSYISLLFVIANIFVIKSITLINLSATSADAFIVGISFSLNLLQEYYGRSVAQKAIWISFAISIFYMLTTYCILAYTPSSYDIAQIHFIPIMTYTGRIIVASLLSYIFTQMSDSYIYAYMKNKTNNKYFIARNYISICLSQGIDTILFTFLGLYGVMPNLIEIMIVSYAIKLTALLLTTPFLLFAKKIVPPIS